MFHLDLTNFFIKHFNFNRSQMTSLMGLVFEGYKNCSFFSLDVTSIPSEDQSELILLKSFS